MKAPFLINFANRSPPQKTFCEVVALSPKKSGLVSVNWLGESVFIFYPPA